MSEENVENAREALKAINAVYKTGDLERWRRHVERTFDPDCVLEAGSEAFTEGDWRGHDGAVGFVANQMEVLEGMWLSGDEIIDVDDDRLVALIRFGGHARHSGIEVELAPGHVFDLRDGKVVRWRVFGDRKQALEAAGLSE